MTQPRPNPSCNGCGPECLCACHMPFRESAWSRYVITPIDWLRYLPLRLKQRAERHFGSF